MLDCTTGRVLTKASQNVSTGLGLSPLGHTVGKHVQSGMFLAARRWSTRSAGPVVTGQLLSRCTGHCVEHRSTGASLDVVGSLGHRVTSFSDGRSCRSAVVGLSSHGVALSTRPWVFVLPQSLVCRHWSGGQVSH